MENNLYYTPTLNEFYIGFESEILGIIGAKEDERLFSKPTIITQKELAIMHLLEIRVKILDQSDIESLGWKDCDNIYNTIRWDFNDYILMFYKKDNRYLIFRDCGPNNIQTVFNGFIKNKSELIKLMQQLNIK